MNKLLETWAIHQKMNELLFSGLGEEHFNDRAANKGRSVLEHFYHLHNVRLMWLKVAMPELLGNVTRLEKESPVPGKVFLEELRRSSDAVLSLLEAGFATGRIKGFKPHPEAFLGYLISHESHHRGQIILLLKENGHLPDKKVLYGLWEWGTK